MQAKSRSMLLAVLVTSAIALLASWASDHAVLLGLLIAGPLLAAASLDAPRTAYVGLYALGLAVLLGIPDGNVGTTDHLLGCLVVATGAALGTFLARRRTQQERALVRVTRIGQDIEQTRAEMGETVEAIGYKADVPSRAKEKVADKADAVRSKLSEATTKAKER